MGLSDRRFQLAGLQTLQVERKHRSGGVISEVAQRGLDPQDAAGPALENSNVAISQAYEIGRSRIPGQAADGGAKYHAESNDETHNP